MQVKVTANLLLDALGLLSKVPPELLSFAVRLIRAIAGSKDMEEAKRRVIAEAAKEASEQALRKVLK